MTSPVGAIGNCSKFIAGMVVNCDLASGHIQVLDSAVWWAP